MRINLRLDDMQASNLVINALKMGIPKGLVKIVLFLSDEGYSLGRKDSLAGKNLFGYSNEKVDELVIKYLDKNQVQQLSSQSKRIGIPESLVPVTLKVIESAYLLGFADQAFGFPENCSEYYLSLDFLAKIAYNKKITTH